MKSVVVVGLALLLALACAESAEHNDKRDEIPDTVDLYFVDDDYKAKIGDVPSKYYKTYQVMTTSVPGTPKVSRVSGSSADVTSDGLIRPHATVWYYLGNGMWTTAYVAGAQTRVEYTPGLTIAKVTGTNYSHQINVTVRDYAAEYVDDLINQILAETCTAGLTELQKLQNITKWVAHHTDYCVNYQSYTSMLIHECGDCWASTNTICAIGKRAGLDVVVRRGNLDPGAGSGHRNALAFIGNTFYIAEAGYTGSRPRSWSVYEEPYGFSYSGSIIYQYDGRNRSVTLPEQLGNRNMTQLGKKERTPVFMQENFTELHISANLTSIISGCLYGEKALQVITVDPKSQSFETVNNVLYTKNKETLIFTPTNTKSLTIPSTTKTIAYTALGFLVLDSLHIPGNVKVFELAAFYSAKIGSLTFEDGLEELGDSAFQSLSTPKMVIPDTVTRMGPAPWYNCNVTDVVLPKNIVELPIGCFHGSRVTHIEIPNKVRDIGEQAIYSCYNLLNVSVPVSVTHVAKNNFVSCSKLTDIYYNGTESQWNRIVFDMAIPETITVHFNPNAVDSGPNGEGDVNVAGAVIGALIGATFLVGIILGVLLAVREKKNGDSPAKVEAGQAKAAQATATPAPQPAAAPAPAGGMYGQPAPAGGMYGQPAPAGGMYGQPAPAPRPAPRTPPAQSRPAPAPRPAPRGPPAQNRPAPAPRPAPRGPATPPRGRPAPPPRY